MTSLGTAFSVSRRYASGGAVKPDRMKQVDGALGGNTGGVFKDKGGTEYYVKRAKSVDVAKNEKLASELYKAIGVPVADKQVTTWKGSPAIAGRMIKGKELKDFKKSQYAGIKELQCNFPADVWLGNYDAVGLHHDNIVVDEDGVAHRIDVGGSLTRRAKGGKKPWWGPKVIEFGAMLNPKVNRFSNSVFNIKGDEIEAGRKEVAQRIADFPDEKIRAIVNKYGPGGKTEKDKLVEDLIARREQVANYYGLEKKYAKGGGVDDDDEPTDDTSFADLPQTPEGVPQITVRPQGEPTAPDAPQQPGFLERSLQDLSRGVTQLPEYASRAVRDWWERGSEAAREGEQQTAKGWQDIAAGQPATGLGEVGMGYLSTLSSPITGLQRPVEKATGSPEFAERALMVNPAAAAKTMGIAVAGTAARAARPLTLMQINRAHRTDQILDALHRHSMSPVETPPDIATPRQMGRITDILDERNPFDIATSIADRGMGAGSYGAIAPWLSNAQLRRVDTRLASIMLERDRAAQASPPPAPVPPAPPAPSPRDPATLADLENLLRQLRERNAPRQTPSAPPPSVGRDVSEVTGQTSEETAHLLRTQHGTNAPQIAEDLIEMFHKEPNFAQMVLDEFDGPIRDLIDRHIDVHEAMTGEHVPLSGQSDVRSPQPPTPAPPAPRQYTPREWGEPSAEDIARTRELVRAMSRSQRGLPAEAAPPRPPPGAREEMAQMAGISTPGGPPPSSFTIRRMPASPLSPEILTPLTRWTETYRQFLPAMIPANAASFIGREILPHYNGNYKQFLDEFFQGLYNPNRDSISGSLDHVTFDGHLRGDIHYTRRIVKHDDGTGYAKHAYLRLPNTAQGAGLNKKLAAGQVGLYQRMGLDHVSLGANIDVGGYAWAKYGYLPVSDWEWRSLADSLRYRAKPYHDRGEMPTNVYNDIKQILNHSDRKALWDLADYDTRVPVGVAGSTERRQLKWGQRVLLGSGWSGILHLKNEESTNRFWNYVGRR